MAGCLDQLVFSHKLPVNDDRAQFCQDRRFFFCLAETAQILSGSCVAVYMSQKLCLFFGSLEKGIQNSFISHSRITAEIRPFVRLTHPGGTPLG